MRLWQFPSTIRGHVVTALAIGSLVLAPAACQNASIQLPANLTAEVNLSNPFGLLINTDTTSDLLGGIRLEDGRSVFAFGSFNPDGTIKQLTGAVLRDETGQEAEITFENNLPKKARAFDGTTFDITWTEISSQRIAGTVTIVFAALDDASKRQTLNFEIDLEQAAAELAQLVEQWTGMKVYDQPPPPDPGSRMLIPDDMQKDLARSQLIIAILAPTFIYAFASFGFILVQVMAQLIPILVQALVGVVAALTQAYITLVCAQFIMLGNIMRLAIIQPFAAFSFAAILTPNIIVLPLPPRL